MRSWAIWVLNSVSNPTSVSLIWAELLAVNSSLQPGFLTIYWWGLLFGCSALGPIIWVFKVKWPHGVAVFLHTTVTKSWFLAASNSNTSKVRLVLSIQMQWFGLGRQRSWWVGVFTSNWPTNCASTPLCFTMSSTLKIVHSGAVILSKLKMNLVRWCASCPSFTDSRFLSH